MTAKALHDLAAFGWFSVYLVLGVVMLTAFTYLYIWRTPWDDLAEVRSGKIAPAIALVGAKIGFTLPLVAASYGGGSLMGLRDYVIWGIVAAAVQLAWLELCFYRWRQEDGKPADISNNIASATRLAGGSVCVGLINAFSMIP